ncbi:18.2 kDa class I heat shock protein [Hibiscus syriacus]|uniref:18.2 kDa class I heat shock protein n=1 Tax=Hibiscus syriacus TaxID=106335 RepID=A0A6A3BPE5_HIBSY|nr:18.1 kDa class I heat shock protein-like [Hibiscus syriacus]KAE8717278.1 18.2 kDa class I heat shock protein [Hibiscus syriacus]
MTLTTSVRQFGIRSKNSGTEKQPSYNDCSACFPGRITVRADKAGLEETPEAHVFVAELPELKRNEVKVEVEEGRVLSIRGEKRGKEVSGDMWQRVERRSGSFVRSFKLPESAKDKLTACLENGVLTITVPKKEAKHYPKRSIEIHGRE